MPVVTSRRETNSKLIAVRAPFEILALIFELACFIDDFTIPPATTALRRSGVIHPHETRQAINLTCFQWRQVAIRVSSLWNHIILAESSKIRRAGFEFVSTEIERSAGRLLALHIDMHESFFDHFRSFVMTPSVAASIGSLYLHYWALYGAHDVPLSFLDVFGQTHWPNLHSLRLRLKGENFKEDVTPILDLTYAPSLVDVRLSFDVDTVHPLLIKAPITCAIRRLDIFHTIELTGIVNLLNSCHNSLEAFVWNTRLVAWEHHLKTFTSFPPLPKLHTLRLDGSQALLHLTHLHTVAPNVSHLYLGQIQPTFFPDAEQPLRDAMKHIDFSSLWPELVYINQRLPFPPFEKIMKGRRNLREMEVHGLFHNVMDLVVATKEDGTLELESLEKLHMNVPLVLGAPAPTINLAQIEELMDAKSAAMGGHDSGRGFCLVLADHDRNTGVGQVTELYNLARKYQGRCRIEFKCHTEDLGGFM